MRPLRPLSLVLAAAAAAALFVYGPDAVRGGSEPDGPSTAAGSVAAQGVPAVIDAARARLEKHPQDARAWARLGTAYVEQARITADPAYYSKADGALRRSLGLRPDHNGAAMTGRAMLAAARHEFATAERWATRARTQAPDDWQVYGVLADARIQRGSYPEAEHALQKMMDLRPGIAAYTRAAHYFELTGRPDRAEEALKLALAAAATPADRAFCHERQGTLAWHGGQLRAAERAYAAALHADPSHAAALAGRGRVRAAQGHVDAALQDYERALDETPRPALVLELAALYESLGREDEARGRYTLFESVRALQSGSGISGGALAGRYEAEHGDPAKAVREMRAAWEEAPGAAVADALGWALHQAGDDAEALTYARRAVELDRHRAAYAYHLGTVERALGSADDARRHLAQALELNPHFSPLHAPRARTALGALDDGGREDAG